jgi:hypothetical protein
MSKTIEQIQEDKKILKEKITDAIQEFRKNNDPTLQLEIEISKRNLKGFFGEVVMYDIEIKVEI